MSAHHVLVISMDRDDPAERIYSIECPGEGKCDATALNNCKECEALKGDAFEAREIEIQEDGDAHGVDHYWSSGTPWVQSSTPACWLIDDCDLRESVDCSPLAEGLTPGRYAVQWKQFDEDSPYVEFTTVTPA